MSDHPTTQKGDGHAGVSDSRRLPVPRRRGAYRDVWVGAFVILALAALLTIVFAMTSPGMFRGRYEITALVDNAEGIRRDDPVRLRGVNVGRVRRLSISPRGVALHLEMDSDYPIPSDSVLVLRTASLLGDIAADIEPGTSLEPLRRGGVIYGRAALSPLERVSDVSDQARQVLARLEQLLSQSTIAEVQKSARGINTLLGQLSGVTAQVSDITRGPELGLAVRDLAAVTEKLGRVADSLERSSASVEAILARMEGGQGSLGRLARDEALYDDVDAAALDLGKAAVELRTLVADIRRDPKKYLKISVF